MNASAHAKNNNRKNERNAAALNMTYTDYMAFKTAAKKAERETAKAAKKAERETAKAAKKEAKKAERNAAKQAKLVELELTKAARAAERETAKEAKKAELRVRNEQLNVFVNNLSQSTKLSLVETYYSSLLEMSSNREVAKAELLKNSKKADWKKMLRCWGYY